MKINRWIFVPLVFALFCGFYSVWINNELRLSNFLTGFIFGAIAGFIIQIWSNNRTKKYSHNEDEKNFSVKQKRNLLVLLTQDRTFDLCVESISHLESARVKSENRESGLIKAKTKMNFYSFGTEIFFNLRPVNKNLTEIEISTCPSLKTTIVDCGESLKTIEKITVFLKERDLEINKKVLFH
ncbi:MAG: hypothetical protein WKF90_15045, partial [Pyrinomonadaceae bacterium]